MVESNVIVNCLQVSFVFAISSDHDVMTGHTCVAVLERKGERNSCFFHKKY